MYQVENITNDSLQQQTLVLPDGTLLTFTMYYVPMQLGWFITSLTYGDFTLNGVRVMNSPNFLYQWKNILPFGIACTSTVTDREPSQQQDFAGGVFQLWVLTPDEVEAYATFLSSGSIPSI